VQTTDRLFAGNIPDVYDRFLVPLIFESYAIDLAERIARADPKDVLETAAGTGVLTRAMASKLPAQARIVATDLNQPMLDRAAARQHGDGRIAWRQAGCAGMTPFLTWPCKVFETCAVICWIAATLSAVGQAFSLTEFRAQTSIRL
jgi:trans-aconitate methyltransferase